MAFIVFYNLLVVFGFVGNVICDSCAKVGFRMNILLTVCAWMHGGGFKLGCRKIKEVFLGDCCNILGRMDYCLVLMQILDVAKSQKYFWVTVVIFFGGWIIVWY